MKKVFTIYIVSSKDVHVPSTDYYARNNEAQTDTIEVLQHFYQADTEPECETYLLENVVEPYKNDKYIILPTFVKK